MGRKKIGSNRGGGHRKEGRGREMEGVRESKKEER